ncbi:MAG: 2-oxo acid dehydrogenase subunit E2, partial [Chloroflexi bacterium]|nr:2-oxo acid dehydrogenase subunit E2 [Chloroflexota bacterium]
MARPIVMPSLGMYTTEGTVTDWLKPPGSAVAAGDPIVEVTTEKASYQVEAAEAGLFHPVVAVGTNLTEGGLIGYLLAAGEQPPAARPSPAAPAATVTPAPVAGPRPSGGVPAPAPAGGEVRATPVARRM